MKKTLSIFLLFFLSSCYFFGTVDQTTMKPVAKELDKKELVGVWNADEFTYKLIQEKGKYKKDSLQLLINVDNTFKMKNIPDFFDTATKNKKVELCSEEGKWSIVKFNKKQELMLSFKKGKLFPNGFSTTFQVYEKDKKITLWYSIGDPDMGERFLFIKS